MFEQEYRRAIETVGPDEGQMERLLSAVRGMEAPRPGRRPGRMVLAAVAVCAVLAVTALALSPGLREQLAGLLGSFAPYSRSVEGASVTDQGIRVSVVSTLADENDGMVYLEVTDLTGGRLDGNTAYNFYQRRCAAYDPETHTALFAQRLSAQSRNDDGTGTVSIRAFLPGIAYFEGVKLPWDIVTRQTLESTAAENGSRLVLKPNQTPAKLNTDYFSLSSMGFDSEGVFHVQIALSDGVELADESQINAFTVENDRGVSCNEPRTLLENGRYLDTAYESFTLDEFGHFRVDNLKGLVNTRPAIEGDWTLTFPLEILPGRTVPIEGETIQNSRLRSVSLTAMTLRLETAYVDTYTADYLAVFPVSLFCRDGTVLHLEYTGHDTLYTDENGTVRDGGGLMSGVHYPGGKERHGAVYLWNFPDAVDPRDVVGFSIGLRYIPLEGDTTGSGQWLKELP